MNCALLIGQILLLANLIASFEEDGVKICPVTLKVDIGENANFICHHKDTCNYLYWEFNGKSSNTFKKSLILTPPVTDYYSSNLTVVTANDINRTELLDSNNVTCGCYNSSFESTATLIINDQVSIAPMSKNVTYGETATFTCTSPLAYNILCYVNNTNVDDMSPSLKNYTECNFTNEETPSASAKFEVSVLDKNANLFNNSNISCRGMRPGYDNWSMNATLRIQGPLEKPTILEPYCNSTSKLCLEWTPPYVLDGINVTYNITTNTEDSSNGPQTLSHPFSECITTETSCEQIKFVCIQAITLAGPSEEACINIAKADTASPVTTPSPTAGNAPLLLGSLLLVFALTVFIVWWTNGNQI